MYVPVVAALLAVLVCCGALPEWAVGQSGPAAPAVTGVVTQASPDGALISYCYDSRIGDVGSVLAEAPLVNVPGGRSMCGQCLWVAPNNLSVAPFLAFVVGESCGGVVGCTGPTRMESQNSAISSIAAAVGDGATWSWAACDDAWFPAGVVIEMHPSSQLFFVQLRLLGSVNGPPVQVEIRAQGGSFAAMDSVPLTPWWSFNPAMALTLPLDVRVTDVLGSQLTMNGFITAFNGLFSTGQQFARGTTGTTATTTGTTATTATTGSTTATTASTSGTTGTTATPPATTGAAAATTGVVMAPTGTGAAATTTGGNASSGTTATTTTATSSLTSATTAAPSAPASPPSSPTSSPSPAPVVANSSGARLSGLILATAAAAALLLRE